MADKSTLLRISRFMDQGLSMQEALLRARLRGFNVGADAVQWDDLRFPATAINPPGLAADPDFDTTNGGWLFAAGSTETLFMIAQLPHAWNEGSTLKPHVHWMKTTSASGNVLWRMTYRWSPTGEVWGSTTDLDVTTTVAGTPDTDTANLSLISSFGEIDASDKQISDMLVIQLSRIGGDASDTYGADARMLEFDIHYQLDSFGSNQEFTK